MEKIFIIEDDDDLRENIIDLLQIEGYKAVGYPTGKNVIPILLEVKPDLIICDIMLPGMDGYQIIEAVRLQEQLKNTPFIFLTALAEMKDLRQGMNLGANDYLLKPYQATELLSAVKLRLSMAKETPPNLTVKQKTVSMQESDTILLQTGSSVKSVKIAKIVCIQGDAEYSEVYLEDKSKSYVRKLMKDWEDVLPESNFLRIHKSIIINLGYLVKAEKWFNNAYRITMANYPEPLISSRRFSTKIREKLIS